MTLEVRQGPNSDIDCQRNGEDLHYMRLEPPLLRPVFRSEAQAGLLSSILLGGDELSLTELAERTGTPFATAHR